MPAWPARSSSRPGAIGYVELAYARQNNLPFADLKNAAGNYVTAVDRFRRGGASLGHDSRTTSGSPW